MSAAAGDSQGAAAFQGMPRIGRYVLVREIARSNDVVWEAADPQMNRRLAVKELALPATLSGQARRERIERFYREARAAGAMSHPAIVTIYEVGEDDGRYFIAMEYLEGQTLRERLRSGPLPLSEAIRITSALCDALSYAHARGVIHRDIKPDNVHLLPGGEVKLTDFGIARITHEESLTLDGQIFGTPSYMSPEQVVGKHIDNRSDIFSLGILLYEMLSGRKPFTGDSVVTITYRILHDKLPSLSNVPVGVDAVVRRAAAKDPTLRFASAADLKSALTQAVSGPDTSAAWEYAAAAAAAARAGTETGQSTLAYSARTQQGTSPAGAGGATATYGAASRPATVPGGGNGYDDSQGANDAPRAALDVKSIVSVLVSILLIAGLLGGGGWLLSRAYQNYSLQAQSGREWDKHQAAMSQYTQQRYETAAAAFQALRESPNTVVRERAPLYESYCWRSLGSQSIKALDYKTAEEQCWAALNASNLAVARAPRSNEAKQEHEQALRQLNEVLRAKGVPASGMVPGAAGNGAAGTGSAPAPNGPALDGMTPLPPNANNAAPAPNAPTASTLQGANNARAAEAARHLQEGDNLWNQGSRDDAIAHWNQAVQTAVGSPAALSAQERINKEAAGESPF